MTTADTSLVCWCLLTSSMWSVYASHSSMNSCKPYDFSGPPDVVFLIDRSQSVSSQYFPKYKNFTSFLVTKAMKIGPDDVTGNENYSHMGVITFVAEAFIDFDLITDSQNVSSSEVLAVFDRNVTFIDSQEDSEGVGLKAALKKAPELLLQRPCIDRKLLFIVSDFHAFRLNETKTELQDLYTQLRNHTFNVFGVGGGPHVNLTNMLDLLNSTNCTARSLEDWKTYVEDLPLRHGIDTDLYRQLCGESSCRCKDNSGSLFYPNGSICQQPSLTSDEAGGNNMDISYAWAIPLAVIFGVVLAVAIMAVVQKWRRTHTRPSADVVEPSEPRAAGRSPHRHLNIGSLSEPLRPSPSTQHGGASESSASAPEQPSAGAWLLRWPESSTLPQGNTIWNRRQQHPSPPPVRTTARVSVLPDDPPPLPPRPVRQPATTLSSFDKGYPEPTSFDDDYAEPSTPPPHDRDPYSYAHTFPGSVFLPGGNHSTQRVSSHANEDMVGPRSVPRRQTLRDILNQVNDVRRNLSIWSSQR